VRAGLVPVFKVVKVVGCRLNNTPLGGDQRVSEKCKRKLGSGYKSQGGEVGRSGVRPFVLAVLVKFCLLLFSAITRISHFPIGPISTSFLRSNSQSFAQDPWCLETCASGGPKMVDHWYLLSKRHRK